MENKIKQVVLEMLRMGEDPHEVLSTLSETYRSLSDARDYIPKSSDTFEFYTAIRDADFRP